MIKNIVYYGVISVMVSTLDCESRRQDSISDFTPMSLKEEILKLKQSGLLNYEIVNILGCAKSTVSYHCKDGSKEKNRIRLIKYRDKTHSYVNNIKLNMTCDCGENTNYCLDFHHTDPKTKTDTVSRMTQDCKSIMLIDKEIEKCIVLCGNCHAKEHRPADIETGENWNGFNKARTEKRKWFIDYLKNKQCKCGESDSRCLEFHHIEDKRFTVGYLITSGHSLDFLKEEISRCVILCVNCHRKIHRS